MKLVVALSGITGGHYSHLLYCILSLRGHDEALEDFVKTRLGSTVRSKYFTEDDEVNLDRAKWTGFAWRKTITSNNPELVQYQNLGKNMYKHLTDLHRSIGLQAKQSILSK